METEIPATEPYQDFLFAINSPVTRERYSTRLRSFFVHIGVEGATMEERCRKFVEKVKESKENANSKWAYAAVIKFLQHQKDRCDKKEITGSTVRGYYKAVKLFAEVNDILLPWSKIGIGWSRCLLHITASGRRAAYLPRRASSQLVVQRDYGHRKRRSGIV